MPQTIVFKFAKFSKDKYFQAIKDLEAAGQGSPAGRSFHAASELADGGMMIVDIWESMEHFDAFGKTLLPILEKNGIAPTRPKVYPTVNVIK
jgi:hypothetical protein